MPQLDLFVDNDRCPHGVSQRNGGWSYSPAERLWVHGDPECGLPKHRTRQEAPRVQTEYEDLEEYEDRLAEETLLANMPYVPKNPIHPGEPFMVCVDPGDVHVGVAYFAEDDTLEHGWVCFHALEMTPEQFSDLFAWLVTKGRVHTLVYERFRLYADKSKEQTGSEFLTSQLIGILRWICRQQNSHAKLHELDRSARSTKALSCLASSSGLGCTEETAPQTVRVVGQMADIKKPTRGILRFSGIKSTARRLKAPEHAVDAELHGWFWIKRARRSNVMEEPRPPIH